MAGNEMEFDASLSLRDEGLSAHHQRHVRQGALGVFLQAVEDGQVPDSSVLIVEGLDRLDPSCPITLVHRRPRNHKIATDTHDRAKHNHGVLIQPTFHRTPFISARILARLMNSYRLYLFPLLRTVRGFSPGLGESLARPIRCRRRVL
ncbi:hypothetical protein F01_200217 [Burkholderia cenocepacia]|nr:hypothetical protein F01_200217 [Burkholderia cenocepacia]